MRGCDARIEDLHRARAALAQQARGQRRLAAAADRQRRRRGQRVGEIRRRRRGRAPGTRRGASQRHGARGCSDQSRPASPARPPAPRPGARCRRGRRSASRSWRRAQAQRSRSGRACCTIVINPFWKSSAVADRARLYTLAPRPRQCRGPTMEHLDVQPTSHAVLPDAALDQLFRTARTHNELSGRGQRRDPAPSSTSWPSGARPAPTCRRCGWCS